MEEAEAELKREEATFALARKEMNRSESLIARRAVSTADYDTAKAECSRALYRSAGLTELDPDHAEHLTGKLAWSTFCQGWLGMLPAAAASGRMPSSPRCVRSAAITASGRR